MFLKIEFPVIAVMYSNLILNDSFQKQFKKVKQNEYPSSFIKFIRDYIFKMESNMYSNSYGTLFEFYKNDMKKQMIREFNRYCLDFLIKKANKSRDKKYSKEAQALIGIAYERGIFGLKKNLRTATNYYIVAAKQNSKLGTYRLAQIYEKKMGGEDGYSRALYFYRCSAKLGCVYGMHTYGSILLRGELNTEKEFNVGLFYLKLATKKANSRYPYPFYDLAQIYESFNTCNDIEPDDDYAFRLYEKGAALGCPNSQYKVGKCYEIGELFKKKDIRLALEFFAQAAENGHVDAQFTMYQYNLAGIRNVRDVDYEAAYKFALQAASRAHSDAAFGLGELIEKGLGVKKNQLRSLWWYDISDVLGCKKAAKKLKQLKNEVYRKNTGPSHRRSIWSCFLCRT